MKLRIGTRGSKLALWQAHHIKGLLKTNNIDSEIITIATKGDKMLDVTISKIGSKGVFTEELEAQLQSNKIDIAVHSAKDMQSAMPDGFQIIAFGEREQPHDVLVSHRMIDLSQNNLVCGTASTRRIAFMKKNYPHMKTVPVRGNIQTRIKKMKEGACDALWLAYAGVHRMGYDQMIIHEFPTDEYVPAVGQGSIAIEVFHTWARDKKESVRQAVNHTASEHCLLAERTFLRKMDGGCSIPIFGLATIDKDILSLTGGIIGLEGEVVIKNTRAGTLQNAVLIGETLAEDILFQGGKELLSSIKKTQSQQ